VTVAEDEAGESLMGDVDEDGEVDSLASDVDELSEAGWVVADGVGGAVVAASSVADGSSVALAESTEPAGSAVSPPQPTITIAATAAPRILFIMSPSRAHTSPVVIGRAVRVMSESWSHTRRLHPTRPHAPR